MVEVTAQSYFEALPNYRKGLDIIELPEHLAENSDTRYVVLRKSERKNGLLWLIAPIKRLDTFEDSSNETKTPANDPHVITAAFHDSDNQTGILFFHLKKTSYILVDLHQAKLLDTESIIKAGYFPQIIGKTLSREFGHTQAITNKILAKPPEAMPKAYRQYVELSNPGNISIKNSVWEIILKNRATPIMDKIDLINHLESMRIRIQNLIDWNNFTVNEAKDHLSGIWGPEKQTEEGKPATLIEKQYQDLAAYIPEDLFELNDEGATPLFRMLQRGYISELAYLNLSNFSDESDQPAPFTLENLIKSHEKYKNIFLNGHSEDVKIQKSVKEELLKLLEDYKAGKLDLSPLVQEIKKEETIVQHEDAAGYPQSTSLASLFNAGAIQERTLRFIGPVAQTLGDIVKLHEENSDFLADIYGLKNRGKIYQDIKAELAPLLKPFMG